jgi:hypothetical protein
VISEPQRSDSIGGDWSETPANESSNEACVHEIFLTLSETTDFSFILALIATKLVTNISVLGLRITKTWSAEVPALGRRVFGGID